MNKSTRIRFLIGSFGLSALVLTLVSDADAYRARFYQLETENRQEREDQDLILLATINMWQDLVASLEDDSRDCGAALEKSGYEVANLEDDLMVCDLQLGDSEYYRVLRDVCSPGREKLADMRDLEDELVVCDLQLSAMRDGCSPLRAELLVAEDELDQCRATSPLWKALSQRESSPAYPRQARDGQDGP